MSDNNSIFGGITKFSGYFDANSQGSATITMARAGNDSAPIDSESFLVTSYAINWGRQVSTMTALNDDGIIAQVGRGQGTIQLQGVVGSLEAFENVLGSGTGADVCNPLQITVEINTMRYKCEGNKASEVKNKSKLVLKACIPSVFSINGQSTQDGTLMQTASMQCSIGGLSFE